MKQINIPLKELRKKPLTIYEALVKYLKEKEKLRYCEIAKLLDRDQRNIRKIYHRGLKK